MYASYLGDFYNVVAAFQSELDSLERQMDLEKRDPLVYVDPLAISVDALMVAIRDLETHLSGAQDLIRDTQTVYRRLVSGFFCRSRYIDQALKKPRGYAGDYLMIEMFYRGELAPRGMERTLDRFALDLPAVAAVVNRKDSVRAWLAERLAKTPGAKVLDLACGSCRIERELIESGQDHGARFVVVDHDPEALAYARRQLGAHEKSVEIVQENAMVLARGKGGAVPAFQGANYAISLGLFDYMPHQIAARLLRLLRESVEPGGEVLIGNFDVDNPNQTFMEWTVDWPLVYRSAHDFFELFLEAGFAREDISLSRETEKGLVLLVTAQVRK